MSLTAPEFDDDGIFSDEPLREACERVRLGDWQAARKVVEDAGQDWELRGWRIGRLGLAASADDGWVDAWLRAEPADPTAVLIRAGTLIRRAIRARGIASSAKTTAEQFQGFHANMEAAAPVLRRAMELAGPGAAVRRSPSSGRSGCSGWPSTTPWPGGASRRRPYSTRSARGYAQGMSGPTSGTPRRPGI